MVEPYPGHEKYLRRCFELAAKGLGKTGLNPLVGSVIVHDNRIIGEGFHREFGGHHAEVNAIESVENKHLLKKSTLYVNLEPCSHYGKTPPCSLLIREMGIPKVVISMVDPNPEVCGKGIEVLKNAGVKIIPGLLEKEAEFLNRRFIANVKLKRPYIILKWAESSDGFIDLKRKKGDPVQPNWITGHTARKLVHKWRSEESAIMAGVNTILADNPSLNVRNWKGRDPVRIVIDRFNRIPENFNVKDGTIPTWIFSSVKKHNNKNKTRYIHLEEDYSLVEFLEGLLKMGISSMIIEGGAKLINSFIVAGLWDEARVFTGKTLFKEGVKAPVIDRKPEINETYRNDRLKFWFNYLW